MFLIHFHKIQITMQMVMDLEVMKTIVQTLQMQIKQIQMETE